MHSLSRSALRFSSVKFRSARFMNQRSIILVATPQHQLLKKKMERVIAKQQLKNNNLGDETEEGIRIQKHRRLQR